MKKGKGTIGLLVAALALAMWGCAAGQKSFEQALSNLTAGICSTPQTQAAFLANLPLTFVTPAQAAAAVAGVCTAQFGTTQAPASAPGQAPAINPLGTPAPSPSAAH